MGKISRHFSSEEFAFQDHCGFDQVKPELLDVLDAIRDWVGAPVVVTSGCRCIDHNYVVGGASFSRHLPRCYDGVFMADGVDIKSAKEAPKRIASFISSNFLNVSYKIYPSWIHLDMRPEPIWRPDE